LHVTFGHLDKSSKAKKLDESPTWSLWQTVPSSLTGSHQQDSTFLVSETFSLASTTRITAWLLYEFWPSWLYALPCYDVTFDRVFTRSANINSHRLFLQSYTSAGCHRIEDFTPALPSQPVNVLLAQGSLGFWQTSGLISWTHTPILYALDSCFPPPSTLASLDWHKLNLNHAQCGGALDGSWTILYKGFGVPPRVPATPICRTLQHIVSPSTAKHSELSSTNRSTPLTLQVRLPSSHLRHAISCPTLYPNQPLVSRALTLRELACALDLPAAFRLKSVSHPSCRATPAKLLYSAFHSFDFSGGDAIKAIVLSQQEAAPLRR
jgi:hypothetical protein